mmetsp:Transcript_3818/g.7281  ORF Transcript_3818/g.7281 Transcript_3818/m.7281 type:complete len:257 (-) Transcript_3818:32-802(-)
MPNLRRCASTANRGRNRTRHFQVVKAVGPSFVQGRRPSPCTRPGVGEPWQHGAPAVARAAVPHPAHMSLSTHVTKWAGAPGPADAQRPGEGARGALSGRRMCPRAAGPASRTPQPQSHTCTTGEGGWAWGWAARGGGMRGAPPPPAGRRASSRGGTGGAQSRRPGAWRAGPSASASRMGAPKGRGGRPGTGHCPGCGAWCSSRPWGTTRGGGRRGAAAVGAAPRATPLRARSICRRACRQPCPWPAPLAGFSGGGS